MSVVPFAFDVVSPQFPCGAAWLANALLELQVPVGPLWGFDTRGEWAHAADGGARYAAAHLPWRQTLASLQYGRMFRFRAMAPARFSHEFPWQLGFAERIVLIVRDPRDALHSEWQRHRRNLGLPPDVPLHDFVRLPFMDGPLGHADMLWLHLVCWQHVADTQPHRVRVLRFEDWKQAPVAALRDLCAWLAIDADDAALMAAAAASDVVHLQAIEAHLAAQDPAARQFNRRGMPYEWMRDAGTAWHAVLGAQWSPVLARLGYAAVDAAAEPGPAFDMEQALAWRGLSDAGEVARWKDRIAVAAAHPGTAGCAG